MASKQREERARERGEETERIESGGYFDKDALSTVFPLKNSSVNSRGRSDF